ncbi:hypothetical protein EYY60_13870 [Flavobacterium zhairuonense]|uniref:hypothetical protein n=1 Tax=Flavobacterium zhairuonense TaxID=2493631 RepID=UPI001047DE63|nr:hypothetical protein [Flavobacterium zhairuonense]KAF2509460.1 hypothetical protein EYY60_13870 [Flavobacterium zhairuonense]
MVNKKQLKRDRETRTIIAIFIIMLIIPIICYSENGFFVKILFYILLIASIILIYKSARKTFNNVLPFIVVLSFLIIIFPLIHDCLIKEKNNYALNEDYINHKRIETELKLRYYQDVDLLLAYTEKLPLKIRQLRCDDSLTNKKLSFNIGYLIISPEKIINHTGGGGIKNPPKIFDVNFYNNQNLKIGYLKLSNETIIEGINNKKEEKENLDYIIKNLRVDAQFIDVWLDSVTIFVFSNIKPIGRITQIIQFLQVITSFLFIYMLTTFLDNFKQLKITKKTDKET